MQEALGDMESLTILQKYQILVQYQRAGQSDVMATSNELEDGNDIVVHKGKTYRRVQIEGKDEEYLMDENQNIYDLNMRQIGKAGDSEDDEGEVF